jgi:hypothetical protein
LVGGASFAGVAAGVGAGVGGGVVKSVADLLQPMKDRLTAATPGPWAHYGDLGHEVYPIHGEEPEMVAGSVPHVADATFIAAAPTDQANLIAAIEGAEQSFIGRAESYRETADRLNQQVIDRDPDRDPEAAARYSHYASAAESALQVFRIAITQALGGDTA